MVDTLACCRGDKLRAVAPASGDEIGANAHALAKNPSLRTHVLGQRLLYKPRLRGVDQPSFAALITASPPDPSRPPCVATAAAASRRSRASTPLGPPPPAGLRPRHVWRSSRACCLASTRPSGRATWPTSWSP
jgi:hypothetical protein